jgi:hypothetical protein
MFVRFRQTQTRLQASLIETRRIGSKVRHEHIGALGSICGEPSIADRITFWKALHERLAKLSNRITAEDHGKILGAIHARVPMVTADERQQLQRENAEADAKFWSVLADMHQSSVDDHRALAAKVERKIADGEAQAAQATASFDAANDRLAKIDKGEEVSGGLGKPMMVAESLQANGFTKRDIQRCIDVARLGEIGAWDELMAETHRRREASRDAALRAVMKRHADAMARRDEDDG